MSIERLYSLESRVERLSLTVAALQQQLVGVGQVQWQMAGNGAGASGDSGGPVRAVLTASLAAGSPASPATAAGTILAPNGSGGWTTSGGTSVTIYSDFATAITVSGSKFCWVWLDPLDGLYYLLVADC